MFDNELADDATAAAAEGRAQAISWRRDRASPSSKPATFEQATSSSRPAPPKSTHNGRAASRN
jgi:hypothetical protein